ncbi:hypothetical protein HK405_006188, partial [Cladochytrium tenue]
PSTASDSEEAGILLREHTASTPTIILSQKSHSNEVSGASATAPGDDNSSSATTTAVVAGTADTGPTAAATAALVAWDIFPASMSQAIRQFLAGKSTFLDRAGLERLEAKCG